MADESVVELRAAGVQDDDAVVALMTAYLDWAHAVLRDRHGVEEPPTHASLIRESLTGLRPPDATILLAERRGRAIGVGAVRGLTSSVVEIKRMYVDPSARGLHVGAAILDRLLDEGRRAGASLVRLDTCEFMNDAQSLYRSRKFVERDPYDGTEIPERLRRYWLFFERAL
jgi:GNAT superfamily N-acetyltransferase